jgi:hypothetical protein
MLKLFLTAGQGLPSPSSLNIKVQMIDDKNVNKDRQQYVTKLTIEMKLRQILLMEKDDKI